MSSQQSDLLNQDFDSYTGWIDRAGKFYPCAPTMHGVVGCAIPPHLCPPVYIGASGFALFDTTFDCKSLSISQVDTLHNWCAYHDEDFDEITSAIFMHLPLQELD